MPFKFEPLEIPGPVLITPRVFKDGRGFFLEAYQLSAFAEAGIKKTFVQDNQSVSAKGVIRGLHYQKPPAAQAKLVHCLKGRIFDVAVDIRKNSPTFGKWAGRELDGETHRMLYVPEGFAHGFSVLSEAAEVLYKVTREYSPENDRGVLWNDSDLAIDWKITSPLVSEKDAALPPLKNCAADFS